MIWSPALAVILFVQSSLCLLRNITVDDEYGDPITNRTPIYRPPSNGTIWRLGSTCSDCHMTKAIDASRTLYSTWHDCTWSPGSEPYSVEIDFEGVAVYTYFILANQVDATFTVTNISFTLDNEFVGAFEHIPTNSTDIQYNFPVYVNETLENKPHTLVISARGPSDAQFVFTNRSLLLFDYMIYTVDDAADSSSSAPASLPTETEPNSSTSRGSKIAIIGGLIAGIVVLLALALALFFFLRRRYKSSRFDSTYTPAVFLEEEPGSITNPSTLTTYGRSDTSKASDPSSTGTSTSYLELEQDQTRGTGRRLRNQEVVNRIAWLEGEMDRLQEEVEMRNDPELPPGYSDVIHPTK